jgi:hypothetical protein
LKLMMVWSLLVQHRADPKAGSENAANLGGFCAQVASDTVLPHNEIKAGANAGQVRIVYSAEAIVHPELPQMITFDSARRRATISATAPGSTSPPSCAGTVDSSPNAGRPNHLHPVDQPSPPASTPAPAGSRLR